MRFLIIARNRAVAVEDGLIAEPKGVFDLVLELPEAEVRPGLINAHDHLHRNHYGRLGRPPYRNAADWARDIQARDQAAIAEGRNLRRRDALLAGAWKNLFAGVTTVMHHDAWEPDFEDAFPLRVLRLPNADSLRMTPELEGLNGETPCCLHLAEGTDLEAAEEVRALDARGLLTSGLIAAHGVGMDADGVARFRDSGAALAWCPSSSLFLFGRTAPAELLADGVDVLLGSDSRLTGAGDLLDELRCARGLGLLSDERLEAAVGAMAAKRLGVAEPSLEPGAFADLVVLTRPLLDASAEDIVLVVASGTPRVARPDVGARLDRFIAGAGEMRVGSVIRWTNGRAAKASAGEKLSMTSGLTHRRPAKAAHFASAACAVALASLCWLGGAAPAAAQDAPAQNARAPADTGDNGSQTDILSKDTLTVLLDARLVVASGSTSWVDGGLGKTRFEGDSNGNFKPLVAPVEADIVWAPRFTSSLSANISAAWQRDQENSVDLIEAFVNYLPERKGPIGVSARAGLMWPEISLEHSTGGAWSVVNTITPSAINSWVGEEVKVVAFETTLHAGLGEHELAATGAVFGYNDTSGTLLSFRGWALQDEKATAFGHFPLPPLNPFIRQLQQNETRSTIDLDKKPGFYARLDWRPPWPFGLSAFYYDNRANPQTFTPEGQWGWRTRFWNVGLNADLGADTKLLAQALTGSTIMGFKEEGTPWVHTSFESAYVLVTHMFGPVAVTGRVEAFSTRERGSEMSPSESENGWAMTAAARVPINDHLTAVFEALNVRSSRGTRLDLGLTSPFEAQTVLQASLRLRLEGRRPCASSRPCSACSSSSAPAPRSPGWARARCRWR